ncbi:MAG TPA: PIN domain-containing protein [Polyangiaceae bacterium]|nr:PIN domain-containing protein [Polyangiaceae bacterium]
MTPVIYDAGVLIAADRSERRVWAEHRVRLELGLIPLVPAPVVAQVSRSPKQAQLRRLLRGCEVIAFDERAAHAAGALLGRSRTRDVVDASVATLSIRMHADVISNDAEDIRRLLAAANAKTSIFDP